MGKKRALVLSGGGSRGSYQIGALMALSERGIGWDSVHGVSVGALNASWYAMHRKEDHPACIGGLVEIWNTVHTSTDIYKPWLPFNLNYIASIWKGSLNSGSPLRKLVGKYWSGEKIDESGVVLTAGCCSLSTIKYEDISSKDNDGNKMLEYVLASSHMPIIFEPLKIDGEVWIDGGLRHQIPLQAALDEGADEIDIIVTSPMKSSPTPVFAEDLKSAPQVAVRATLAMSDQVYLEDCLDIYNVMENNPKIKINLYMPSRVPTPDSMNFSRDHLEAGIRLGYLETKHALISKK